MMSDFWNRGGPQWIPVAVLLTIVPLGVRADTPKVPVAALPVAAPSVNPPVKMTRFSFRLPASGQTSAGVYDAKGRLVQVLWTMKPMTAGKQTAAWDGKDQFGQAAPPGKYGWRVVVNRSVYY